MKNFSPAPAEKNALAAIILCALFFLLLPSLLVRLTPSLAAALNSNPWLMMMPTVLIGMAIFAFSGSFHLSKADFTGLKIHKLCLYSFSMVIIAGLSAYVWETLLKYLHLHYDTNVPVENFIKSCSRIELCFAIPLICLIVPFFEEMIFRRIIFEGIRYRCPPVFSMTVTSLLFAGLHGIFFQLVPLFVLGMCFQGLYMREGKLGASFFAHCFNNTLAFSMLLLI